MLDPTSPLGKSIWLQNLSMPGATMETQKLEAVLAPTNYALS